MRITEILSWNNEPAEGNRSNPRLNYPPAPFRDDLTNVANAFTRRGAVKHLWNLNGLGAQPSGPAPPGALHLDRTAHGIHDTRKLRQKAVAGVLDDPAVMLADLWLDQLSEVRLEPFVRALLIHPHQARIPCHVGGEDGGEAADRGHDLSGGRLA
jgi:hypothetical protein